MSATPNRQTPSWRQLLFGLLAVGCLVATGLALVRGGSPVRLLVVVSLTGYALVTLAYSFVGRGVYASRVLAVPLGVVGVVALLLGAPTDLPVVLVLVGVGSLVDLLWDPTGVLADAG
ncbi:hypothetical protein SAMN04487949_2033 [Halogranum gelatinilyticum]|uniref:Uncharacterized protein n=1 Tax=Halogranum gelatinilyticum TaxID=660521 RepID=A0A1G9U490_9EURY|nr:hypothetical protein [Halogranum gelatinilyticum]SDM54799.1 hypothetical protein SAMN04487949_2033 [Halogranum gelatinilyticum]